MTIVNDNSETDEVDEVDETEEDEPTGLAAMGMARVPRGLFTYPGSKSRLARWVIDAIGPHQVYLEPFAGTLSVLLAKSPCDSEIINDLDGDIVNFYHCIRDHPKDMQWLCDATPYSRLEFDVCKSFMDEIFQYKGVSNTERARRWWYATDASINGMRGTWVDSVLSPRVDTIRLHVKRFASVSRRLARVQIENADARDLIAKYSDDPSAVIYMDPPYVASARHRMGAYRCDVPDDEFHEVLSSIVEGARAHVLISGYPSPLYSRLFGHWHKKTINVTSTTNVTTATSGSRVEAVEVLWSNRPMSVQSSFDFFTEEECGE